MRAGEKRISLRWRENGLEWMKVRRRWAGERLVEEREKGRLYQKRMTSKPG